jgi:hypothetical protein
MTGERGSFGSLVTTSDLTRYDRLVVESRGGTRREKGEEVEVMGGSFAEAMFASYGKRFGMSREQSRRAYIAACEEQQRQATKAAESDDADNKSDE